MKTRMHNIDAIKGFAMLLVILGHMNYALIGNTLFTVLYSFHMPLFFLLTGYMFKKQITDGYFLFVKKKAKALLIPYATFFGFSLLYGYVIRPFITKTEVPFVDFKEIIEALFLSGGHLTEAFIYNFPLWFLPLLFLAEIVFYWIVKIQNKKIIFFIMLALFLSVEFIQTEITGRPMYHINVLPMALIFISVGWLLKGKLEKIKFEKKTLMILALIALYMGSFNMGAHVAKVNNVFIYTFVAMIWIIIVFSIFNKTKEPNVLTYIGENSLTILGVHAIVINAYYALGISNYFDLYNGIVRFVIEYLWVMVVLVAYLDLKAKMKRERGKKNEKIHKIDET